MVALSHVTHHLAQVREEFVTKWQARQDWNKALNEQKYAYSCAYMNINTINDVMFVFLKKAYLLYYPSVPPCGLFH